MTDGVIAAVPATVRRAATFIYDNAGRPITLADIVAAAGVGPRALQLAFRRYHGTTPMRYLRRVRLEQAHRELQAADPTTGDTVAAIAERWHFSNVSRFAGYYRKVYGQSPSWTLRT